MDSGEDFDVIVLRNAIKAYNKREYKPAFQTFKSLASKDYSDSTDETGMKIYGQATFYLALCYMHGHGVKQNKDYALSIANHLLTNKKYNAAWNIYRELTEDGGMKFAALVNMAFCYNQEKKLIHNEEIAFKISLELYSKKKYKEAFDIFSKLTSSTNDEIKFIVTCLKASYNISGYNNIKRDKNEAFNLINTIKLK
ncbi:23572_t:CDS:1 [Gigaspora margarita]|uniref:23572_t:CDS:1 n=1 Tax=Gigaspora margarita TaxID=4874 RepID=A0ABN7XAV3_GIGMA|nr:23572_t:CDS:1 [Gigaspora margarita]